MSGERLDMDPAAQVAAELRARLRSMGSDELVELCAQLLSTYVMEGVLPLSRAAESTDLASDAAGEELKAARKDAVLDRFIIDGENISVRIEGQGVLPLTEYRRPVGLPASGPGVSVQVVPRREGAPGAAGSVYNRSLYHPEAPTPVRGAPQQAQQPAAPPAPAVPSQQQPAVQQKKSEEPRSDRFSLIELE